MGTLLPGRLALLALAAAGALAAGVPPVLAGAGNASAGCGNQLVFLVWPRGHAAIPRIAALRNPHIELYRGFDSGYSVRAAGAYVMGGNPPRGKRRGASFAACRDSGDAIPRGSVASPRETITGETAVRCTLPGSPVTDVVLRKKGVADLYVHSGSLLLAQAHVTRETAELTVPAGHCRLVAPPRP
jgi:hypothetical protein